MKAKNKPGVRILGWKLLKALPRLWLGEAVPLYCQWDVTYRCDQNCSHCFLGLTELRPEGELDLAGGLDLIRQLKQAGTLVVYFCGGEPTLRKDLGRLLAAVRAAGMTSIVATNGQQPEKSLPVLAQADWVRVSINGDRNSHDRLCRNPGSWDRAISTVAMLRQRGVKTSINCVVWPGVSRPALVRLIEAVRPLGAKIDLSPITTDLKPLDHPEPSSRIPEVENLRMPIAEFIKVVESLRAEFGSLVVSPVVYRLLAKQGGLAGLGCRAAATALSVRPDGTFSLPCTAFPAETVSGPVREVLKGTTARQSRETQGKYWFCVDCYSRCMTMPSLLVNPFRALQFALMYFQ